MVFSSLTFLYLLLPLTALAYFLCKNRAWRNGVLLAASLAFYAWGEPKLAVLLLGECVLCWAAALVMERAGKRKTAVFVFAAVLLTACLFVFKYLGFAAQTLGKLTGRGLPVPALALPLGISFYTFQILSYLIDVRRGSVKAQRSFFRLLLYICVFPQLIMGPIVRYGTVEAELCTRSISTDDVSYGLRRFILGLSKKVLLANGLAKAAEIIYAGDSAVYGTLMYWAAAVCYSLQIYFDFSGYSDMAVGLGRIFGFHFPENFDRPYLSRSVTEFWRRWHITLGSWFRDYIYIPLGGNRVKKGRWVLNILIVWALTGLWHGAQWNFVLWGLYYGVWLLLEKCFLARAAEKLPGLLRWAFTALIVTVGWVLFNLTDGQQLLSALKMMFSFRPTDFAGVVAADAEILHALVYLPLGVLCILPLQHVFKARETTAALILDRCFHAALLVGCIVFLVSASYNPFIYFRF